MTLSDAAGTKLAVGASAGGPSDSTRAHCGACASAAAGKGPVGAHAGADTGSCCARGKSGRPASMTWPGTAGTHLVGGAGAGDRTGWTTLCAWGPAGSSADTKELDQELDEELEQGQGAGQGT